MKTDVLTPQAVFFLPQHLVVPLFQRPYVWDEDEQWLPLWQDIERLADSRVEDPYRQVTHFLGAVVLQALEGQQGSVPEKNVIDGQQRLTTLQLLIDACAAVFEGRGLDGLAEKFGDLAYNPGWGSEPTLKLVHTNDDGAAFREVMDAEVPVEHAALKHSGSRITRAHAFFVGSVERWLGESDDAEIRAQALSHAITQCLQLVVIDLQAQENSQEIFETLNARGTPLTAADLIKNFVFQRLEAEGADTKLAYAEDWPFEAKFWEQSVSVGRVSMTRGSLFLNQWLGSRVGEELSPKQTFIRFKSYVDLEAGQKMSPLLRTIKAQAEIYRTWAEHAADSSRVLTRPEMAFYRMSTGGVELLKPALIWLYDPERAIPTEISDEIVGMLESWMVRRQLLRLTSADLGRIVANIIESYMDVPPTELVDRVRSHLTGLSVASTYWPGDDEIREHLRTEQAYRRYPRGRMRLFLEAVEDHLRSAMGYPQVARMGYPIEHVMPQKWEARWDVGGLEAQLARSEHVHRLGNLTLLTTSLNSRVSNGAWQGDEGKRAQLLKHDVLLLNRYFHDLDTWDEAAIDERTEGLTDLILQVWPVPAGHAGEINEPVAKESAWVELKHLIAAGLLPAGTVLTPRPGPWPSTQAAVTADGNLTIGDAVYSSPSSAGHAVKGGKATNGWTFWELPDGRRLREVRALYRGETSKKPAGYGWVRLHQILEAIPAGHWASYTDLADAIGTASAPLGAHMNQCKQCAHVWRVRAHGGRLTAGFAWSDPSDTRDPDELLRADGVVIDDGRADPAQKLTADALAALVTDDAGVRA